MIGSCHHSQEGSSAVKMPSDRKKKQATKAKGPASKTKENGEASAEASFEDTLAAEVSGLELDGGRTASGNRTSHPQSRDLHIEQLTLLFHGEASGSRRETCLVDSDFGIVLLRILMHPLPLQGTFCLKTRTSS